MPLLPMTLAVIGCSPTAMSLSNIAMLARVGEREVSLCARVHVFLYENIHDCILYKCMHEVQVHARGASRQGLCPSRVGYRCLPRLCASLH